LRAGLRATARSVVREHRPIVRSRFILRFAPALRSSLRLIFNSADAVGSAIENQDSAFAEIEFGMRGLGSYRATVLPPNLWWRFALPRPDPHWRDVGWLIRPPRPAGSPCGLRLRLRPKRLRSLGVFQWIRCRRAAPAEAGGWMALTRGQAVLAETIQQGDGPCGCDGLTPSARFLRHAFGRDDELADEARRLGAC